MPKLYRTEIAAEADLKVHVTDVRGEADLVVHETTDAWSATESTVWCYTDVRGEASKVVFFTSSPFEADLIIFRTDVQPDAEWVNPDKAGLLA